MSRRRDAIYCGKPCRQAAHRARVGRLELEATDRPLRLAYADPPYVGRARRYYGREASFAGEVDHSELLSRLATYDGWALSCAADSIPRLLATVAEVLRDASRVDRVRLAIWHRRRPPHPHARRLSAYEGLIYSPARFVVPGSTRPITDVLLGVESRPRPTLPGSIIGMKPPAFCVWVFQLLGALPGDDLADLFPGSGMVSRAWAGYTGRSVVPVDTSPPGSRDSSRRAAATAE